MSHTEGKISTPNDMRIVDENGLQIATVVLSSHKNETLKANARRLVACWNALDEVPTEWLENYVAGNAENILQENAALVKERDELVAALRKTSTLGAAYYALANPAHDHKVFLEADEILAKYPEAS